LISPPLENTKTNIWSAARPFPQLVAGGKRPHTFLPSSSSGLMVSERQQFPVAIRLETFPFEPSSVSLVFEGVNKFFPDFSPFVPFSFSDYLVGKQLLKLIIVSSRDSFFFTPSDTLLSSRFIPLPLYGYFLLKVFHKDTADSSSRSN